MWWSCIAKHLRTKQVSPTFFLLVFSVAWIGWEQVFLISIGIISIKFILMLCFFNVICCCWRYCRILEIFLCICAYRLRPRSSHWAWCLMWDCGLWRGFNAFGKLLNGLCLVCVSSLMNDFDLVSFGCFIKFLYRSRFLLWLDVICS